MFNNKKVTTIFVIVLVTRVFDVYFHIYISLYFKLSILIVSGLWGEAMLETQEAAKVDHQSGLTWVLHFFPLWNLVSWIVYQYRNSWLGGREGWGTGKEFFWAEERFPEARNLEPRARSQVPWRVNSQKPGAMESQE